MATKKPAKAAMSKVSGGGKPTLKAVSKETKKPIAAATVQKASAGKNSSPALTGATAKKYPTSIQNVNAAGPKVVSTISAGLQQKKAGLDKAVVGKFAGGSTGAHAPVKATRDPVITVKVGNKVPASALPGTRV